MTYPDIHDGPVYMQKQHRLETGRRPYGLHGLVESIPVEQRYEITKMHRCLRK